MVKSLKIKLTFFHIKLFLPCKGSFPSWKTQWFPLYWSNQADDTKYSIIIQIAFLNENIDKHWKTY